MKLLFEKDYIIDVSYDYSPMRKGTFTKMVTEKLEGRELDNAEREKHKRLNLGFGRKAYLTKKEKTIRRGYTYKKLFKEGDSFELKGGINIMVGDNGCGKSTLIEEILKQNKDSLSMKKVIHVDMEKSNPTISKPNPESLLGYSAHEISNQFMWSVESHGETREGVLMGILMLEFDLLILDEPEQGLSLRNQLKYLNKLKEMNKDIIIISHSKVFIENVNEVFDVEKMKWINSKKYLSACI